MRPSSPELRVDVWCARTPAIDDSATLTALEKHLTRLELSQEAQYRLPELKIQYCLSRVLTRTVLGRLAGCDAHSLEFELGPHGKPQLCNPCDWQGSFNISHTRGAVLLAVASQGHVGIDVERCDRRVNLDLADRYFAKREIDQLQVANAPQRARRFLEFWTLKEAFIKALGTGLATPLHSFAFQLTSETGPRVETYDEAIGPAPRWAFRQFEFEDEFIAAVAVVDGEAPTIDLHLQSWDW